MAALFTVITEVIVNIFKLLEKTSEILRNNYLFMLIIGIVVLYEIIHLIFNFLDDWGIYTSKRRQRREQLEAEREWEEFLKETNTKNSDWYSTDDFY